MTHFNRHPKLGTPLLALLLLVVMAAGCGAQPGTPVTNPADVRAYEAKRFDVLYDKAQSFFSDTTDVHSVVFMLARVGDLSTEREIEILRAGTPPTIYTRSRDAINGYNLNTYHIGGSPRDFLLLGDFYDSLAPTPWVSYPTLYESDYYTPCLLPGIQQACALQVALNKTQQASPEGLVKKVIHKGATTTLLTGVTFKAFLNAQVIKFPPKLTKTFGPKMLQTLIPVRITFKNGQLQKFEVNGVIKDPTGQHPNVKIQFGLEILGTNVGKEDFPPRPSPLDVTKLKTEKARERFFDRLAALQNAPSPPSDDDSKPDKRDE